MARADTMIAVEPQRILRALLPAQTREPTRRGLVSVLDVLERYSFRFSDVLREAGRLSFEANLHRVNAAMYESTRGEYSAFLEQLWAASVELDLGQTADLAARVKERLEASGDKYAYAELRADLDTLLFSFVNGLEKEVFIRVPHEREPFFQQDALFGSAVAEAFPSSADDIQHAGTCYALDQHSACVFHLMRVLERGLATLARELRVDFDRKNWATVIDGIEAAIKRDATAPGVDPKRRKVVAEAAIHLRFVKDAWRNDVMHAGEIYDAGRAQSVLDHVRDFMRALADAGLSEPTV